MKIYFDTGFFFDYFSLRSLVAVNLRKYSRRGRSIQQIQNDANEVTRRLGAHDGITSVITVQEYATVIVDYLKNNISNLPFIKLDHNITSKYESLKIIMYCKNYSINLEELNINIINSVITSQSYLNHDLYDAIHIDTAINKKCDMIISNDKHLLSLDNKYNGIRIVDSNDALLLM